MESADSKNFRRGEWPLMVRRIVTGMFQENSWLIRCMESGETALLDPGEDILEELDSAGLLEGLVITKILLTHAHLDHVWGLSDVHERWPDAPIVMHPDDLELLRALPLQGGMIGMPLDLPPPPEPSVFLHEGDTLTLGRRTASVIHTPGHTRGGICFVFDTGDVFVGDMIIQGSVGRTDLPGGNPVMMESSLRRLCGLDPEYWIYGGHGPQKPMADELRTNHVIGPMARGDRRSLRGIGM